VDNNWDEFFSFDSKSAELPVPKQHNITPKRTGPTNTFSGARKPTPLPHNRRRSNLRELPPPTSTTDDDDWDKDFEGGLSLHSPRIAPTQLPALPPLSPKKTPASPRKLSPPKGPVAGNISDDNSKTIRPGGLPVSSGRESRKTSVASTVSSSEGNTVRGVPIPRARVGKSFNGGSNNGNKRVRKQRLIKRDEGSDEGYEDLIKDNETKFAMKVNSLKVCCPGMSVG
jgi:hypothetical protein